MWLPSSPYLPCGRTPGGPPVGACPARAPFGHGRVVCPAPSLRCLPTLPRCPRGGGVRVPPLSSPLSPLSSSLCSTHVAGTTQARRTYRARLQWGGGGLSPSGPPYPRGGVLHQRPLRAHIAPAPPHFSRFWSLSSRFLPLARWFALFFFFLRLHRSPPISPPGTSVCPLPPPHVPSPPPRCPRPFPGWVGERGVGGGGGPRCPSSGVSTSQARRRHEVRHLSLCRGGGLPCGSRRRPSHPGFAPPVLPPLGLARRIRPTGTVVWSIPHPLSAASPPCRFVLGGGGALSAPPFLHPSPLGGRRCVGGGGGLSSSLRCTHVAGTTQARRRHEAQHLSLCRRGGMPCGSRRRPFYPAFAPPVVRPLGLARRVLSTGTVVLSVPHPLAAASPPCRFVLGGGGAFRPPLPASPTLGGAGVCEGGGAPMSSSLRCTHVAGTTQARRKHGVRHLAAAGGGVLLWAFPPFSMV